MKNYQSPEAVEVGNADESILGCKPNSREWDEVVMNFVGLPCSVVDTDE